MPAALLGREEPRVWTPPVRELTPETSLGFECIAFAEDVLGLRLLPWQKWLLVHALELAEDGRTYRFDTVVLLVARQNGKTTLMQVMTLWRMYMDGADLVLGTAQNLQMAEDVWSGAVQMAEGVPELADEIAKVDRSRGAKSLELESKSMYRVAAASRRGGRGMSCDLVLLDELREHQTWDAWGAAGKTTLARPRSQKWAASNAGDAASVVLRYLRKAAHAALGDPDGINAEEDPASLLEEVDEDDVVDLDSSAIGLFEWSAEPGRSVRDEEGWAQANPSLGHGTLTRAKIAAALVDPEWVFRTEVLCQWSSGALEGPFPAGAWEAGTQKGSTVAEAERYAFCVEVSWDRTRTSIAVCGRRADGVPHVQVVADRVGTDWVKDWFAGTPDGGTVARQDDGRLIGVAIRAKSSPASSLFEPLREAGVPVIDFPGIEQVPAVGAFYDAVRGVDVDGEVIPGVYHEPQPALDVAAATAKIKPLAGGYVWDMRTSPVNAGPLQAVTGAFWLLNKPVEASKSFVFAEDYELGFA